MPRRQPRENYSEEEEVYDVPRRSSKRTTARPPPADDEDYYVSKRGKSKARTPVPVPVEEFERLRVRDRAPSQPQPPVPPPMPLGVRYGPMDMEGFGFRRGKGEVKKSKKGKKSKSAPVSEEEEEEEEEDVRVRHVKKPKAKGRRKVEEEDDDEEEEVGYKEKKKKGGKKGKSKKEKYAEVSDSETSSEEEDEEDYVVPVRRGGRPAPMPLPVPDDDEDDSEEEVVHRRKKKGKVPVEPEYERATRKSSKRGKGETVRYPSVPKMKSRRRDETESETETETESESESDTPSEDSEDEEIVVRKSERGRARSKGKKGKNRKDDSSSPGSPSLREPSMSRHKRRQKLIDTEYGMVKPTRAPSPDFPRPKSGKRQGRSKDDMFIEPFDPYANWPPVETSGKKKKGKTKAIQPRARSADRELSVREHGRRIKDTRNARDDLEVDLYSRRKPHYPSADFVVPKGALVTAGPKSRHAMRGGSMSEIGWPSQPAGRKMKYLREQEESSSEESSEDEKATPYLKSQNQPPNQKDRLWTEITKDLVVREAIERAGYEYEETEQFYYIFAYLHYEDVSGLVDLSEEIRQARRQRIHEIGRERSGYMPPAPSAPPVFSKYGQPMLDQPRPWPWDGHRMGQPQESTHDDSRWRLPSRMGRW